VKEMRKLIDNLVPIIFFGAVILGVILAVGAVFGFIDLGVIFSWIGVNFAKFCLIVIGIFLAILLIVCCAPALIIIAIGTIIVVIVFGLIALLG
jgi:hypothetical protein